MEQLLPGYAGPCFPVDQQSVACPIGVTTNEMEYRRYSTLTGIPVPAPDARLSRKSNPWRIRLDDGSICVRRIPSTMPGAPAPAEVGTDMVSDPVTFDCDYGAYADLAIPAYVQIAEDGEPRIDAYGLVHVAEADREKAQELQRSAGGKWTVLHANVGDQSLAEVGVAEAWF